MASIEEILQAEDDCAACSDRCADVYEYPKEIIGSIDRSVSVQQTGANYRWSIVLCSGVAASKWPSRVAVPDSYAELCDHAVAEVIAERGGEAPRVRVNLITKGSEDGGNPEEACDVIIFPEHIRYLSVHRHQLKDIIAYHFNVIGPRFDKVIEAKAKAKASAGADTHGDNGDGDAKGDSTLADTLTKLSIDDANDIDGINNSNIVIPNDISSLFHPMDIIQSNIGKTSAGSSIPFPFPLRYPFKHSIFLCGHKLRDKRCGVTAPILYQQFEDILDAKGFTQDNDDYFMDLITHVGGHKYAGNVIIYSQVHDFDCVWYGRVFPNHVENIVNKTIIDGEILLPITRSCSGKELF